MAEEGAHAAFNYLNHEDLAKSLVKEIEKNPNILSILLDDQKELARTKQELNNERTKYVIMTAEMQRQLQAKAEELKTTQGLLIGGAILMLLSQMNKRN